MIKLLLGGSPCTHWSIAQHPDRRETEASGLGWELFLNYKLALESYQPDFFLYENNKSMDKKIRTQITKELGVEPVLINSALVSAQNRQRLYWVGKRMSDGSYAPIEVSQPANRGLVLKDVLDGNFEGLCVAQRGRYNPDGSTSQRLEPRFDGKTNTVTTVQKDNLVAIKVGVYPSLAGRLKDSQGSRIYLDSAKSVSLKANGGGGGAKTGLYAIAVDAPNKPIKVGEVGSNSQGNRIYSVDGTSVTQTAQGGGIGSNTGLYAIPDELSGNKDYKIYVVKDGSVEINNKVCPVKLPDGHYVIRKLSVSECKRLQTVPDDYTFPVSDSQAYKMLGNGWTVEVIKHLIGHFEGVLDNPVQAVAMYDGMSGGQISLTELGVDLRSYISSEIDKYAVSTTQANFPNTIQIGDAFQVREADFSFDKFL